MSIDVELYASGTLPKIAHGTDEDLGYNVTRNRKRLGLGCVPVAVGQLWPLSTWTWLV